MKRFLPIAALLATITVLVTACGGPYSLTPDERRTAEMGSLRYSQAAGLDHVSCSGSDSDLDGYVTCTAKTRKDGTLNNLACSYKAGAEGCKIK